MFKRTLYTEIQGLAKKRPIITLLGPRQSGKTTLVRKAFPEKPYVDLEDFGHRELATLNPKSFMGRYPEGAIFDEVQRVPISCHTSK